MSDIKIKTHCFDNIIEQETIFPDDMRNEIVKQVINLKEQGIREALLMLGWTPPEEGSKKMRSERLTELVKVIHKDLNMRADEDGVIPISNFIWTMIKAEVEHGS